MILKSLFLFTVSVLQFSESWSIDEEYHRNLIVKQIIMKKFENNMSPEELAQYRLDLIFPGTKWCGSGHTAANYDDLGSAAGADSCCRNHDHCDDTINPGETKYNLTNEASYTRLHCECDERFRLCLKKDKTDTASTIGMIYFDIIGTQCFRKDYNATGCRTYGGWVNTKCLSYEYDFNSKKFYQWFHVRNFF